MSAPSTEEKKAEYINLSFLAALTARGLRTVLENGSLDQQVQEALPKAEQFLRDIASGADFVATGNHPQGFDPVRAVGALDFALGPLEQLQQLLTDDKNVAAELGEVAEAIGKVRESQDFSDDERNRLQFAVYFFSSMYDSLSWLLDHSPRSKPTLDVGRDVAAS